MFQIEEFTEQLEYMKSVINTILSGDIKETKTQLEEK